MSSTARVLPEFTAKEASWLGKRSPRRKLPLLSAPIPRPSGWGTSSSPLASWAWVPETRQLAGPDIESQTRQALENLRAILEAAGSCLRHVVKTTVFLVDLSEWPRMNAVYAEFFPQMPPARSAVGVAALPMGARVEIEAVAEVCDCPSLEACGCR
jgi:2-iminobutanoate/2-iminopropanoate deaminase